MVGLGRKKKSEEQDAGALVQQGGDGANKPGFFRKNSPPTPPMSTPDSAKSVPESVNATSVDDAVDLHHVDSQVSELTSPGAGEPSQNVIYYQTAHSMPMSNRADPPAAMMRSTSLEADRQSSGQASGGEQHTAFSSSNFSNSIAASNKFNGSSYSNRNVKDPPVVAAGIDSSIVTKVLGIVDLSCGGQEMTTASRAKDMRHVLSFQNEWGLKPDLDDDEPVGVSEYHHAAQFQQAVKQQALLQQKQQQQQQQATSAATSEKNPVATAEMSGSTPALQNGAVVTPTAAKDSPNRGKRHENFELIYKEPEKTTPPKKSVVGKIVKKLSIKRNSGSKKDESTPLGIARRHEGNVGNNENENSNNLDGNLALMDAPVVDMTSNKNNGSTVACATAGDSKKGIFRRGSKKKDDSDDAAEGTHPYTTTSSSNKQRYKKVLKSIKTPSKMPLEAIDEEAECEDLGETFVRVPGIQSADGFLSDKDLIGEEVVEELYTELDKSIEEEEREQQHVVQTGSPSRPEPTQVTLTPSVPLKPVQQPPPLVKPKSADVALATVYKEFTDESEDNNGGKTTDVSRSRSWVERLGLKKTGSKEQNDKHQETATTVTARTPATSDDSAASSNSASKPVAVTKKPQKPMWKAVMDQNTGKTYYYHRKTRETTWQKPPDEEIVVPADKKKTNADDHVVHEAKLQAMLKDDFESKDVWEKKKEIARMLTTMAPSNGTTVERLVTQYKGKEDELLTQLRDLKESKPFDEPLTGPNYKPTDGELQLEDETPLIRTRTVASIYSGFSSSKSRVSERTEPIRNTGGGVNGSMVSTVSSRQSEQPIQVSSSPARIPKNIPVPRQRELNVEEFSTSDRIYRARRVKPVRLPGAQNNFHQNNMNASNAYATPQNRPHLDANEMNYLGDNEDTDKDTMSYATDSVSALSEADLSTLTDRRESAVGDARIRALDRAIAQEDWDLAAQISEGIRSNTGYKSNGLKREVSRDWAQSDLDRFIVQNDWDAVTAYIAQHRTKAVEAERAKMSTHLGKRPPAAPRAPPSQARAYQSVKTTPSNGSDTSRNNPEKRFGAKSQLQHQHLNTSADSYSSGYSTYDSEYTSESSYTDEEPRRRTSAKSRPRRPPTKEFAC